MCGIITVLPSLNEVVASLQNAFCASGGANSISS